MIRDDVSGDQPDRSPASKPARVSTRERGLERVYQVFEFLHQHGRPIRVADLAKQLGAPRSSIYELTRSLTDAGLLETFGDDGRLFFGKRLYLYGMDFLRQNDLIRRGRDEVERLAREIGETSELCMLHNDKYTIVHMSQGTRPFRISSAVGAEIPIPWTASGRLLLGHLSDAEIRSYIAADDLRLPNGTEITMEDFIASVRRAHADGYCVTTGQVDAYTRCIAAPIARERGRVAATLCFVVPNDMSDARTDELRQVLVDSTQRLSTVS